eukprot:2532623-Pyramimonas_sp.AAC.1
MTEEARVQGYPKELDHLYYQCYLYKRDVPTEAYVENVRPFAEGPGPRGGAQGEGHYRVEGPSTKSTK